MKINLIYGPPGTGKTTKLLSILDECFKRGTPPEKIAFVSFTKKGTYEGKDRAIVKFGFNESRFTYFRTIHSLAFRFLELRPDKMITKKHYKELSKKLNMSFTGYYTEDLRNDDDKYLFCETLERNTNYTAQTLKDSINNKIYEWVKREYNAYKKLNKIYDYTDIVELAINRNISINVDVAIIDEAQDLTNLQWLFVWKAFSTCKEMYIAGDDDQAIYEWSGADTKQFLSLNKKADNVIVLNKSYRLPKQIHFYSNSIVNRINNRIAKEYAPNNEEGSIKYSNSIKEINIDNVTSWMILCRNNYFLNEVCEYLYEKGIVYTRNDKLSYSPVIIKAIIAHNNVRNGLNDSNKYLAVKNMSKQTFVDSWFNEFDKISLSTRIYYKKIIDSINICVPVIVSTIHGVKGGEANNVVLLLQYTKAIEENYLKNSDSELRCYYVAVTRARKNLYLVNSQGTNGYKIFK